jgi:hypothetical protein
MVVCETENSISIEFEPIKSDLDFDLAEFERYLTIIEEMLDKMEREDEEFAGVEPTGWV